MDLRIRILKESGILFSKYGIKSITMDMISNELGISKRTLYENFKDKDQLVKESVIEGMKALKKNLIKLVENDENILESILKVVQFNHSLFGKINPLFHIDLKKYHSNVMKEIFHNNDIRDYSFSSSLFIKGQKDKSIREEINIQIFNIAFHQLIDLCAYSENITGEETFTKNDIQKSILLPYLRGACTEKGMKELEIAIKKFEI